MPGAETGAVRRLRRGPVRLPGEACEECGRTPCACEREAEEPGEGEAGGRQGTRDPAHDGDDVLASGRHADERAAVLEALFGKLPEFFQSEDELRALWSAPGTRTQLLGGLAEQGFGGEQLAEMQKLISAEKSDLFDVLAYVAYTRVPVTREERALRAGPALESHFSAKQITFLEFVLGQYVKVGVEELSPDKLSPLLKLRYNNAIADAIADLGPPPQIGQLFASFQQYLYAAP